MYVRPKLTFVSFFMFFFAPSPYSLTDNLKTWDASASKNIKNLTNASFGLTYIHTP